MAIEETLFYRLCDPASDHRIAKDYIACRLAEVMRGRLSLEEVATFFDLNAAAIAELELLHGRLTAQLNPLGWDEMRDALYLNESGMYTTPDECKTRLGIPLE